MGSEENENMESCGEIRAEDCGLLVVGGGLSFDPAKAGLRIDGLMVDEINWGKECSL